MLLLALAPERPHSPCVFGPGADSEAVGRVLRAWAQANALGPVMQWGISFDKDQARVHLGMGNGTLEISWRLDVTCSAVGVHGAVKSVEGLPMPAQASLQRLTEDLPTQRVHESWQRFGGRRPKVFLVLGSLSLFVALVFRRAMTAGSSARRAGSVVRGATVSVVRRAVPVVGRAARRAARGALQTLVFASPRAALATAGILVGLIAVEIVARLTGADLLVMAHTLSYTEGPRGSMHRTSEDPFLHYELNPGHHTEAYVVNVDAAGARFPSHPLRKGPGVFRILCYGASTMHGSKVTDEQTIPADLERWLNRSSTRHYEVWNLAVSAYVESQAAHRARQGLRDLDPDLILVQLHNTGARPFFHENGTPLSEPLRTFMEQEVLDENFPAPPGITPGLHHFGMSHFAAYRLFVGARELVNHGGDRSFAAALDRRESRLLATEAAERRVPVLFLSIPADEGSVNPNERVYEGVPPSQWFDMYRKGQEKVFYEVHPPAPILDDYAHILADELRARGLIPG